MSRTIKLSDVAKAAGVSQGTASNAFNRPDIVRREVRERVEAAARTLGYAGPDPKGRLLRAGKVNAIGVATTDPLTYFFDDPYARAVMAEISSACDEQGAGISLVSAASDEKLAWNIQSAIVDGFILFCIEGGSRLVELTRERRLPFVALELETNDESISAIGIDNVAGARLVARHIGELGHRRAAILSLQLAEGHVGPVDEARIATALYRGTIDRIRGYRAGLAEFGVEPGAIPIFETENDVRSVEAGLDFFFAADPRPTAILAMSDRAALIALDWLRRRGLRVPEDVSVTGFDGVPEGEHSEPPLTTVTQPLKMIGRLAVDTIFEAPEHPQRRMLPVELTLRASTGLAASEH
ncbi:LacI family DNA-binding transcriptional regulator [Kaistia algarum]|uniref:LacI family DNA-binding transcriptional regulator n=1 Tax=Kaistia algarum TaxID=2083279 RepID=UPI00225024F9|nr:LacI family DNA-binding transcriptional regulator [Kaistia algarum]MCX5516524.1 LacI family DNA-binding transcriptional regulator [Kaistia algarum]